MYFFKKAVNLDIVIASITYSPHIDIVKYYGINLEYIAGGYDGYAL